MTSNYKIYSIKYFFFFDKEKNVLNLEFKKNKYYLGKTNFSYSFL